MLTVLFGECTIDNFTASIYLWQQTYKQFNTLYNNRFAKAFIRPGQEITQYLPFIRKADYDSFNDITIDNYEPYFTTWQQQTSYWNDILNMAIKSIDDLSNQTDMLRVGYNNVGSITDNFSSLDTYKAVQESKIKSFTNQLNSNIKDFCSTITLLQPQLQQTVLNLAISLMKIHDIPLIEPNDFDE